MEARDGKHPPAWGSLTNHLDAHEVLARGNARRNNECGPSVVVEQSIHPPLAIAQTFLVDLEPVKAVGASRCRVVDLGTGRKSESVEARLAFREIRTDRQ